MKWRKIIEQFPAAFDRLCVFRIGVEDWKARGWRVELEKFFYSVGPAVFDDEGVRGGYLADTPSHLYDFFDGAGLYVKISPDYQTPCQFLAGVIANRTLRSTGGAEFIRYGKREEAEEAAFMLAFEMMEAQLCAAASPSLLS